MKSGNTASAHLARLPSGNITFLLTDVQGSTQLWEENPAGMSEALARHDSLLSRSVSENGGVILKSRGEGDSVFAVFTHPRDALRAALQAQIAVQSWREPVVLRVRMAIHTGEADIRDGDYYGPVVNRSARLRAIAHGDQTILSEAVRVLLGEDIGEGVFIRDLGWHRLKDLGEPEHVFQLCHPDLPVDFPPLQSLDLFPNNLPVPRTSFVGRESDIARLRKLLGTVSLVTLTGAGGAGKSRLAQQLAAETLEMFRSGAWLVELAALNEPELVPQAVASALAVRLLPGKPVIESLTEFLADKNLLLILDNCEHLIEACAQVADRLLSSSSDLKVLATSREPLHIEGEVVWRVSSLSIPDLDVESLDGLVRFESVRLLIDRLSLSRPGFQPGATDVVPLTSISRRLDGIPLALELAAARARSLPLTEIAAGLDDRFRFLAGGLRTSVPRHQTLRAAVAWSYDGLSEEEQLLFRRLSVFSGGFHLEAAQEVCAPERTRAEILDLASRLVDKSLINLDVGQESPRYGLLETIRQYSLELLSESGEEAEMRSRHFEWFIREAERYHSNLLLGDETRWLEELEPEHDNIRAALEWRLADASRAEAASVLAESMWLFWWLRGFVREGIRWLEQAVGAMTSISELPRAGTLFALSFLYYHDANLEESRRYAQQALDVSQTDPSLPDWVIAAAKVMLAEVMGDTGDFAGAWPMIEEAIASFRSQDSGWGLGFSLSIAGGIAVAQGDIKRARVFWEEMLDIQRKRGIEVGLLIALQYVARLERLDGKLAPARLLYEESLEIRRRMGAKRLGFTHGGIVAVLGILGRIAHEQGDYAGAQSFAEEALEIASGFDDRPSMGESLLLLSDIARAQGRREEADEFAGRASSLR